MADAELVTTAEEKFSVPESGSSMTDAGLVTTAEEDERFSAAEKSIRRYAIASSALGLVPLPLLDLIAVTSIQLKLVGTLAQIYKVSFSAHVAKALIGSLIGSAAASAVALPLASLIRLAPVIGLASGIVSIGTVAAASTYAVGRVFTQHFASGGTLLTFDPAKVRTYYAEQFELGLQRRDESPRQP